jgi:hypothetical protein
MQVGEAEKKERRPKSVPLRPMKYGFFAVMGGFEVSIGEIRRRLRKYVRLSPKGVLQLAKLGYPLHVLEAHIDDKGKANLIQKSLVMLQVTWMAIQCITRRAYGLPLTLLEIHTMVHVVCALTMYIFWFYVRTLRLLPLISPIFASLYLKYSYNELITVLETTRHF